MHLSLENTRKSIKVTYASTSVCVFVLIVLSVFSELNGILHETKHFSFDLDSIPPMQTAEKPLMTDKTSTKSLDLI